MMHTLATIAEIVMQHRLAMVCLLLAVGLAPAPAAAQRLGTASRCYEFDRAYFDHPDGGSRKPTALVRFEPDSIRALAPLGRRRMVPVTDPPTPDRRVPLEAVPAG